MDDFLWDLLFIPTERFSSQPPLDLSLSRGIRTHYFYPNDFSFKFIQILNCHQ